MRRFLSSVSPLRNYLRNATQFPEPLDISIFNPENQNHLARALAESSIQHGVSPEYDKDAFLQQYSKAEPILNICSSYGLSENSIMNAIEKHPDIINFDSNNISSVIKQFQILGFNNSAISTIFSQYPHVMQFSPSDISSSVDAYRKKRFGERFIIKLIVSYPLLLSLSNENILERLNRVNYLMENKINRTTNLLLRNPSLMCCNWKDVEEKYAYLYHNMRIVPKEMSRSQALTLPLSHIILRHTFLDRCGVYIRAGLKDDEKGFNPHKNPSLHDIVDSNDHEFATRVAKVSLAEFEVFKSLMHYEDELENDDNDLNLSSDFDSK